MTSAASVQQGPQRRIKALVCDFDGVLLESAQIKTQAFAELFEGICPGRISEVVAYHQANMGISRYVKFRHIFNEMLGIPLGLAEEQALGRRFSELAWEQMRKAPLVVGVREFLEDVRRREAYALFVASGTPEEELIELACMKGLYEWFVEWHGAPKTKPNIIRDILRRYGWGRDELVFVGDALSDRIAAEEVGVMFVGRVVEVESPLADCRHRIPNFVSLQGILQAIEARPGARKLAS